MTDEITNDVRSFWEKEPCGTSSEITGNADRYSREWFDRIEKHRYAVEPEIRDAARFEQGRGKLILEVGVGAGTDHLQWARAGAVCHGVDLTDAAVEATRKRLALYGFESDLRRMNAEKLPFEDGRFDLVYSWGVIHHADDPARILQEIRRVLKPGGVFIGMMYGRHSLVAFKLWIRHALLKARPWRSLADVLWHHMESIGTKAYTTRELRTLFCEFTSFEAKPVLTFYDRRRIPAGLHRFLPCRWGWFITLRAVK